MAPSSRASAAAPLSTGTTSSSARRGRSATRSIEVRPEPQHAFSEAIREQLEGTIWLVGGCNSWYLNERGGTSVLWPGTTWEFAAALRVLDPSDYELDWAPAPAERRAPVAA